MPFKPGQSGNPAGRFRPGVSGNPAGRPPSPPNIATDIERAIGRPARVLADLAVKRALNGDADALVATLNVFAACVGLREKKPAKRAEASPTD